MSLETEKTTVPIPAIKKIMLSGGGYSGRTWEATYDHLYVIEVAPAISNGVVPEGSFSVASAVIRPLRYNATGRYEAEGEENLEIYEFIGTERMFVVEKDAVLEKEVVVVGN